MTASPSLAIFQGHIHDHFRGLKLTLINLFLIQRESTVLTLSKMEQEPIDFISKFSGITAKEENSAD